MAVTDIEVRFLPSNNPFLLSFICRPSLKLGFSLKSLFIYALVAQLEEHMTFNHGVPGSSPGKRTTYILLFIALSFNGRTPLSKSVIPSDGVIWVRVPGGQPWGRDGMADMRHLECRASRVWVQVPSPPPLHMPIYPSW